MAVPMNRFARWLRRLHWRNSWLLLVLALLLGLRVIDWRPMSLARGNLFALYQTLAPTTANSGRVVVVLLDRASVARLGHGPWPRSIMAVVTRKLTAAGAVVGFDATFEEPDRLGGDAEFAEAISEGRVVLASSANTARQPTMPPKASLMIWNAPAAALTGLPAFTGLAEPVSMLAKNAAGIGPIMMWQDENGVFRRLPMVARSGGSIYPSFALELARVLQGGSVALYPIKRGPFIYRIALTGPIVIPTGWQGDVWPRFSIAPLRTLSVLDVLDGRLAAGSLAGQIAIVGTSADEDLHMMPVGRWPGVFFHAVALDNILTGSLLWRPIFCDSAEIGGAMLLGGLVVIGAALTGSRRSTIAAWLVVTVFAGAGSFALFLCYGWLLDPAAPIITVTTLLFVYLLVGILRRGRPTIAVAG